MTKFKTTRRLTVALVLCAMAVAAHAQQRDHIEIPREQWQRVSDVLRELGVTPGSYVADVGAGSGFMTVRLSKAVGEAGRVYAVDVNPVSLRELKETLGTTYANVELVRGEENDPRFRSDVLRTRSSNRVSLNMRI